MAILKQIRCICLRPMALTPSTMLALGTGLPNFDLPQVMGGRLSNRSLDQRPVLLKVLCAHCPFVKHVEPEITRLDHDFSNAVQLIGVSSNSLITHPQDGPEQLADQARRHGWSFPYLLDEQQTLAQALRAACTPEFYCSHRMAKACRACAIAANWTGADPATISPSMVVTCGPPSRPC